MNGDDMELVRAYAASRSEEAFETLVSRYVNLVYSAALRQAQDAHLAEEITQAVFIILSNKAGRLGPGTVLPSWLYRTARFTAADALKARRRREQREHEAYMQKTSDETGEETWTHIAPLLDDAMDRLGEKDHAALVLRFFENRNFKEVGTGLGASEDAAKMRVNRALEKLRRMFARQGTHSTTAIIAGSISTYSVQAAPAALAKSATMMGIAHGAGSSASTLALMKGAIKLMAWTQTKTTLAIGAVALLAVGTTTIAVKTIFAPLPIQEAYVKLYSGPNYGGEVLTDLPWEAPSNSIGVRGDLENFAGLRPDSGHDFDFNDKAWSVVYLLPKGDSVVLYANSSFDGSPVRLVGTGKVQKIPDFNLVLAGFNDSASSLHWEGIKEAPWQRPRPDFSRTVALPGYHLMTNALFYLFELKKNGKLPGAPKNNRMIVILPNTISNAVVYPVTFEFPAKMQNVDGPFPYHFTIFKASATDSWQLTRAWRTDTNGNVAEEYPLP